MHNHDIQAARLDKAWREILIKRHIMGKGIRSYLEEREVEARAILPHGHNQQENVVPQSGDQRVCTHLELLLFVK